MKSDFELLGFAFPFWSLALGLTLAYARLQAEGSRMPTQKIPTNATLLDLTGNPAQREDYVRKLVKNFYKLGRQHTEFWVRIGTQGTGHSPHYRFELLVPVLIGNSQAGFSQDIAIIYSGLTHDEMTAFEIQDTKDENWSTKIMKFAEVQSLLGDLRARPRRI